MLNTKAGAAHALRLTADSLRQRFESEGHWATVDADEDIPFEERVGRALRSDAEIVVAAGGDGTATALAGAVIASDKTLAVLPLGTVNLLARDLGLPLDLDQAVAALGDLQPQRIDVGEVNGRIFLHNVTIGFAPALAAKRELIRGRRDIAAKLDYLRHFLHRLFEARRMAMKITPSAGAVRLDRVRAVTISNNAYDEGPGRIFSRQRLDRGELALYILRRLSLPDLLRLFVGMLIGSWRNDGALAIEKACAASIDLRREKVRVTIDGEVETLDVPLQFRIRPQALSVLAPMPAEDVLSAPERMETTARA